MNQLKKTGFSFLLSLVLALAVSAQPKDLPKNWYHLDKKETSYSGISLQQAYDLVKAKQAKTVIVAVIDGGTDTEHEDLKSVIWVNKGEIPGNGIDDDKNGYIDDINGWNFIGGKDSNVDEDSYEMTRVYAMFKSRFKDVDSNRLSSKDKEDYRMFLSAKKEFLAKRQESQQMVTLIKTLSDACDELKSDLKTENPTVAQIKAWNPLNPTSAAMKNVFIKNMEKGMDFAEFAKQMKATLDHFEKGTKYSFNTDFNPRTIIGDNYEDVNECCYGNNRVTEPNGEHGTHVAGIIGAVRGNNIGMDGVAANVQIMVLRVVPDGDERDKDVANAIRYAVDNGAKVINMSFGKSYSPYKAAVDAAIKYAESKDVLLVHAAGNDGKNTNDGNNFPRDLMNNGSTPNNWIEIGASSYEKKRKKIAAPFSNYGEINVDIFAPGMEIYSTTPKNTYDSYDGTSMAAPVTAGVAALIRSYYPQLTAAQVKQALMEGSIPVKGKVIIPGSKKKAKMKELCVTGGILNAYQALLVAERLAAAGH